MAVLDPELPVSFPRSGRNNEVKQDYAVLIVTGMGK